MSEQRKKRIVLTKSHIEQISQNIDAGRSLKEISNSLLLSYSTVKRVASELSKNLSYVKDFRSVADKLTGKENPGIVENSLA